MQFPRLTDRDGWNELLANETWPKVNSETLVRYYIVMRRLKRRREADRFFRLLQKRIRRSAASRVSGQLPNCGRDIVEIVATDLVMALVTPKSPDLQGLRTRSDLTVRRRLLDAVKAEMRRKSYFVDFHDDIDELIPDPSAEANMTQRVLLKQAYNRLERTAAETVDAALLDTRKSDLIPAKERYAIARQETSAASKLRWLLDDNFDYDDYILDKVMRHFRWCHASYIASLPPDEQAEALKWEHVDDWMTDDCPEEVAVKMDCVK